MEWSSVPNSPVDQPITATVAAIAPPPPPPPPAPTTPPSPPPPPPPPPPPSPPGPPPAAPRPIPAGINSGPKFSLGLSAHRGNSGGFRAVAGGKNTLPLLVGRGSRYQLGSGHSITSHKDISSLSILLRFLHCDIFGGSLALCLCLPTGGGAIAGSHNALRLSECTLPRGKPRARGQAAAIRGPSRPECRGDRGIHRDQPPPADAGTTRHVLPRRKSRK